MTVPNREKIVTDLAGILGNFHGKEYSGAITEQTLFFADLGLASIDAVVLAEDLQKFYGRQFPFNMFLSNLSQRGATDLEVGELAAFLHQTLKDELL